MWMPCAIVAGSGPTSQKAELRDRIMSVAFTWIGNRRPGSQSNGTGAQTALPWVGLRTEHTVRVHESVQQQRIGSVTVWHAWVHPRGEGYRHLAGESSTASFCG